MRRSALALALAAAAAALAACSSEPMKDPGIATFRADAVAVKAAATSYQAGAATMADVATCTSMHAAYDAEVRPMLERMRELAPAMDAHMAQMGGSGYADMACAAQQLLAELDRHAAAACASPTDMGPNVAEVGAHGAVMDAWADHERVRCDELGGMMDGGGMMGGRMGGGMRDPGTLACPPAP